MAESRALLTETERKYIAGDVEEEQRRYEAISRVRARIRDELPKDLACLEEHHPTLLEELQEAVCSELSSGDERGEISETVEEPPSEDAEYLGRDYASDLGEAGHDVQGVAFDALDLPGSGETLKRRQEAVRTAYEFLKERGQAKTARIREYTWENSETGYANATSMWKNCVSDGLQQVAEQDDLLYPPGEGEHTWVHAGRVE